jgi:hypothetical protein
MADNAASIPPTALEKTAVTRENHRRILRDHKQVTAQ